LFACDKGEHCTYHRPCHPVPALPRAVKVNVLHHEALADVGEPTRCVWFAFKKVKEGRDEENHDCFKCSIYCVVAAAYIASYASLN